MLVFDGWYPPCDHPEILLTYFNQQVKHKFEILPIQGQGKMHNQSFLSYVGLD